MIAVLTMSRLFGVVSVANNPRTAEAYRVTVVTRYVAI